MHALSCRKITKLKQYFSYKSTLTKLHLSKCIYKTFLRFYFLKLTLKIRATNYTSQYSFIQHKNIYIHSQDMLQATSTVNSETI